MLGSVVSFCFSPLNYLIQMPHMFLALVSAPRRLFPLEEILTSWPTNLLATPRLQLLLAIIIEGDFPVIIFLVPVGIFLVYGATENTQTEAHLVGCTADKNWSDVHVLAFIYAFPYIRAKP
jgi:hypothetical protein